VKSEGLSSADLRAPDPAFQTSYELTGAGWELRRASTGGRRLASGEADQLIRVIDSASAPGRRSRPLSGCRSRKGRCRLRFIRLRHPVNTSAALTTLVDEADPPLCRCGSRMRIVSVIRGPSVVDVVLKHVNYCFGVLQLPARSPPPAGPPEPDWDDLSRPDAYDMQPDGHRRTPVAPEVRRSCNHGAKIIDNSNAPSYVSAELPVGRAGRAGNSAHRPPSRGEEDGCTRLLPGRDEIHFSKHEKSNLSLIFS